MPDEREELRIMREYGLDQDHKDDHAPVAVSGRQQSKITPRGKGLLAKARTGDWLEQAKFDPMQWLISGLVPEGLTLLIGGPKIGKSWMALDFALSVAAGNGYALGKIFCGIARPVLYLALEDSDRRLKDRIRKLQPDLRIPSLLTYMTRTEPGMIEQTIIAWLRSLPEGSQPLVILDVLAKVMPPKMQGENDYQRDYRVASRLKMICDGMPGMGMLVLHHDRKASADDFVDMISGTNGIAGATDTIMVIDRGRNEGVGLLKITGRDVLEAEYAVKFDGGIWSLSGETLNDAARAAQTKIATKNLGDRSAQVVKFVSLFPDGVKTADVAEALDMTPNEASVYLGRLYDHGRLSKPQRGLYTSRSVGSVVSNGQTNTTNTFLGVQETLDHDDEGE
jgi:hypothetical protein